MRLVVVGTEHPTQVDEKFKGLLREVIESAHITLIGEEWPSGPMTVGQKVARSKEIPWVQVDMTEGERIKAGIHEKLESRMQAGYNVSGKGFQAIPERGAIIPEDATFSQPVRYAPEADGIREEFWLAKIAEQQVDGALLICGAVHARKIDERAQRKGYETKLVFFPETPGSEFWVSITPQLF